MIPWIVHRIWLDDPLPPLFAEYGERWRELHPTWQVIDWVDRKRLPPLQQEAVFRDAQRILPKDWKRFEADVLRLELLRRFGGLYVDADVEPFKSFDPLMRPPGDAFAARSPQQIGGRHPITNAVMAAKPHHRFITACLQGLPEAVRTYRNRSLARMIGPWHLTRTYRHMDEPRLHLYPTEYFYPEGRPTDESYCDHKWNNARRRRGEGLG